MEIQRQVPEQVRINSVYILKIFKDKLVGSFKLMLLVVTPSLYWNGNLVFRDFLHPQFNHQHMRVWDMCHSKLYSHRPYLPTHTAFKYWYRGLNEQAIAKLFAHLFFQTQHKEPPVCPWCNSHSLIVQYEIIFCLKDHIFKETSEF
jgi:hypothetical protein